MPRKDKEARNAYNREWRAKNIAKNRAYHREYDRTWRALHGVKLREYQRNWKRAHPETVVKSKTRMRTYRATDAGKEAARRAVRKRSGLPEPTRPRPEACELCGTLSKPERGLCVDHDHVTGEFRGWLCGNCNRGLGLLGDIREGVVRALKYFNMAELL